jgi:hypothetical protein
MAEKLNELAFILLRKLDDYNKARTKRAYVKYECPVEALDALIEQIPKDIKISEDVYNTLVNAIRNYRINATYYLNEKDFPEFVGAWKNLRQAASTLKVEHLVSTLITLS